MCPQRIRCSDSGPWYEQGRQCLFSLYTDMRLCPLEPRRQSCRFATTCNSLNSGCPIFLSMAAITCYAPRVLTPVSRYLAQSPASRPSMSCKGRVAGSKPASLRRCDPLLTKLMSSLQLYFLAVACVFQSIALPSSLPQVACSRGLTGPAEGAKGPRGDLCS